MTQPDELLPCREAFEKWYFPHRQKCWDRNILLDENDANSMWEGFKAAYTRATPRIDDQVDVEALKRGLFDAIAENYGDDPTHVCIIADVIDYLTAHYNLTRKGEE